jgi:hypothetical protein
VAVGVVVLVMAGAIGAIATAFESSDDKGKPAGASGGVAAPAGAAEGELQKDCGFGGCASDLARNRVTASEVWCLWNQANHVVVHLALRNPLNAHVTVQIVPRYEIEDGGVHGNSTASERSVSVNAQSTSRIGLDAGTPEGVVPGSPIKKCFPRLIDADITNR